MRQLARVLATVILITEAGLAASDNSFYAARRDVLMNQLDRGLAVLQGAPETRAYERFRQNNDFYYLSGVETPGALMLLDSAERRAILFLPPRNRMLEAWEGPRMYPGEEARTATGFDEVLEVASFGRELEKRRAGGRPVYCPHQPAETTQTSRDRALLHDAALERDPWDGRPPREKAFRARLKDKLGDSAKLRDLSPLLDRMRRVKDAQEIERLREAGRIGSLGIMEAIRSAEPGNREHQVAAAAEFVFNWHGAGPGYFAIAGSGANSCILHYNDNSRRLEAGDLMVLDFGPDYRYYQSDITRTFPVSGKFSEEQAAVYRVVLEAQKAAISKIRPGATLSSINQAAREVIDRHGFGKYWKHGVSHYVGMSTHDVGGSEDFVPGVVVTVEPGIYITEKALGVRIEDTVLVTADGFEILSRDVPKEIAEIEKLMAEPGLALQ
jgi:Xaa-Pro aminopeptidase